MVANHSVEQKQGWLLTRRFRPSDWSPSCSCSESLLSYWHVLLRGVL